jgi:hypothetical protein
MAGDATEPWNEPPLLDVGEPFFGIGISRGIDLCEVEDE